MVKLEKFHAVPCCRLILPGWLFVGVHERFPLRFRWSCIAANRKHRRRPEVEHTSLSYGVCSYPTVRERDLRGCASCGLVHWVSGCRASRKTRHKKVRVRLRSLLYFCVLCCTDCTGQRTGESGKEGVGVLARVHPSLVLLAAKRWVGGCVMCVILVRHSAVNCLLWGWAADDPH